MRKIIFFFAISLSVLVNLWGQDTCTNKRTFTYTDESKKTIIVKELLIYTKAEKKFVPFTYPANFFLDEKKGPPIGIRFFNFGCIKTTKKAGKFIFWNGQVCYDKKEHAIFSTPLYGIRGFIKLIISYTNGSRKTLYDIFDAYAPADDCQGSATKDPVTGKCPPNHPNNEPEKYASKVAKGLGIGVYDILKIRDADGKLSPKVLSLLLSEVATVELGLNCKIEEQTIKQAIKLL